MRNTKQLLLDHKSKAVLLLNRRLAIQYQARKMKLQRSVWHSKRKIQKQKDNYKKLTLAVEINQLQIDMLLNEQRARLAELQEQAENNPYIKTLERLESWRKALNQSTTKLLRKLLPDVSAED